MFKNTVLLFLAFSLYTGIVLGQDTTKTSDIALNISADLMSRFVWRGTQLGGNSPSLQPAISLGYKNLEIGAWGAYSLDGINPIQELDLYLSYSFAHDMFTISLMDYFSTDESSDYSYFTYGSDETEHILEATLGFNGLEKLPLSLLVAFNFYGADGVRIEDDPASGRFNQEAGIQYSNYFELGYLFGVLKTSIDVFMGFTLSQPKPPNPGTGFIGEEGFYGGKAGVVNVGFIVSKEIKITERFAIPISASLITNPMTEKVFFVLGLSF